MAERMQVMFCVSLAMILSQNEEYLSLWQEISEKSIET